MFSLQGISILKIITIKSIFSAHTIDRKNEEMGHKKPPFREASIIEFALGQAFVSRHKHNHSDHLDCLPGSDGMIGGPFKYRSNMVPGHIHPCKVRCIHFTPTGI